MRNKNSTSIAMLVVALALVSCFLVLSGPAFSDETTSPSPSPSPSVTSTPSPSPPPAPAPAALVQRAKVWRTSAQNARSTLCRFRDCFLAKHPVAVWSTPRRSESEEVWKAALKHWRYQSRDWWRKVWDSRERMCSTKGGGALRWRPLIRWWWPKWTEKQVYLMAHIIWHESSGRPFANAGTSLAYGLFQHLPNPGTIGVWAQARLARYKYDHGGLAHWNGCKAFTCRGGCGIY